MTRYRLDPRDIDVWEVHEAFAATLATELHLRQLRDGVLGVCVGSGQGVALVLENSSVG
jgi:acetyl-CoA acetyltransferase